MKKIKILQIAPLAFRIPPDKFGALERVIYHITNGLVDRGFDVTLLATGDSKTKAKLVSVYPTSPRDYNISGKKYYYDLIQMSAGLNIAKKFDIVHNHLLNIGFFFNPVLNVPTIHTLHWSLPTNSNDPIHKQLKRRYKNAFYISISNSQRSPIPSLNYISTVYNGIKIHKIKFNPKPEKYLIWFGKIKKNKGPDDAIKVAKMSKRKLLLIGKIAPEDNKFFEKKIKPHIDGKQIIYLGEMERKKLFPYIANAYVFLNPIRWNEPFGLVMIEAMASGTPVISYDKGSAREIIIHGKTGFIVKSVSEMSRYVDKIDSIKRIECRKHVERNFTVEKMVDGYVKAYQKILKINRKHIKKLF